MRCFATLVILLAACGDNLSLQVSVVHPDNLPIETTVVTIYESAGDEVRCADIEFQDVSETVLAGLEVSRIEQSSTGTIGEIDGVSRTGTKLVVARGFRDDQKYLTAGCTEHGTISGNDKVVVETVIVAAVSIGGVEMEGNDAGSIPVTITTPLGAPLPKRPISWRVFASSGATPQTSTTQLETGPDEWEPTTSTCAGPDGSIRVRPVPPGQIGGYAARVRVSWGEEPPRQFSGFTRMDLAPKMLAPLATALGTPRICTSRVSGTTKRLVCLEDNDPSATVEPIVRDLSVTASNGVTSITTAASQMFAPADSIAGVYSLQSGANRDAYAITSLGRVIGLFNPTRPPNGQQTLFTATEGVVVEVLAVPSCQAMDPPRLAVRTVTGGAMSRQKLWLMEPLGGMHIGFSGFDLPASDTVRLSSAGCVTELQMDNSMPASRQVIVIDSSNGVVSTTTAFYDCSAPGGKCMTRLPTFFSGVGFKRGEENDEDRLVASTFDTSGTVISELIFLDTKLVERARISAASIPDFIVSGNFDGDTKTDLLWNFLGLSALTNFQVAYARKVDGAPLTALTGPKSVTVDDMFTTDVTGDGFDDVMLVSRSRDGTSAALVSVVATRAPAAPLMVRPDDACTP